ncbi:hypothetical protein CEUSTIGMA_g874.t1 [Chlamydomonas eustigma]|uniref:Uncharacterized protein n=1 Tax=Chlamydomonas eustigma TaxID=1157962 RepID=A0A250WRX3_9CHLO|nr:hypothetical protein CEUSTIGMA_g874.t1 [Chlamydomonas eustigma]|eukprot:GAX73422.1 hypothetical protein CEUSTIGMA_g874.t1 [Chlamydomonas eustigma]
MSSIHYSTNIQVHQRNEVDGSDMVFDLPKSDRTNSGAGRYSTSSTTEAKSQNETSRQEKSLSNASSKTSVPGAPVFQDHNDSLNSSSLNEGAGASSHYRSPSDSFAFSDADTIQRRLSATNSVAEPYTHSTAPAPTFQDEASVYSASQSRRSTLSPSQDGSLTPPPSLTSTQSRVTSNTTPHSTLSTPSYLKYHGPSPLSRGSSVATTSALTKSVTNSPTYSAPSSALHIQTMMQDSPLSDSSVNTSSSSIHQGATATLNRPIRHPAASYAAPSLGRYQRGVHRSGTAAGRSVGGTATARYRGTEEVTEVQGSKQDTPLRHRRALSDLTGAPPLVRWLYASASKGTQNQSTSDSSARQQGPSTGRPHTAAPRLVGAAAAAAAAAPGSPSAAAGMGSTGTSSSWSASDFGATSAYAERRGRDESTMSCTASAASHTSLRNASIAPDNFLMGMPIQPLPDHLLVSNPQGYIGGVGAYSQAPSHVIPPVAGSFYLTGGMLAGGSTSLASTMAARTATCTSAIDFSGGVTASACSQLGIHAAGPDSPSVWALQQQLLEKDALLNSALNELEMVSSLVSHREQVASLKVQVQAVQDSLKQKRTDLHQARQALASMTRYQRTGSRTKSGDGSDGGGLPAGSDNGLSVQKGSEIQPGSPTGSTPHYSGAVTQMEIHVVQLESVVKKLEAQLEECTQQLEEAESELRERGAQLSEAQSSGDGLTLPRMAKNLDGLQRRLLETEGKLLEAEQRLGSVGSVMSAERHMGVAEQELAQVLSKLQDSQVQQEAERRAAQEELQYLKAQLQQRDSDELERQGEVEQLKYQVEEERQTLRRQEEEMKQHLELERYRLEEVKKALKSKEMQQLGSSQGTDGTWLKNSKGLNSTGGLGSEGGLESNMLGLGGMMDLHTLDTLERELRSTFNCHDVSGLTGQGGVTPGTSGVHILGFSNSSRSSAHGGESGFHLQHKLLGLLQAAVSAGVDVHSLAASATSSSPTRSATSNKGAQGIPLPYNTAVEAQPGTTSVNKYEASVNNLPEGTLHAHAPPTRNRAVPGSVAGPSPPGSGSSTQSEAAAILEIAARASRRSTMTLNKRRASSVAGRSSRPGSQLPADPYTPRSLPAANKAAAGSKTGYFTDGDLNTDSLTFNADPVGNYSFFDPALVHTFAGGKSIPGHPNRHCASLSGDDVPPGSDKRGYSDLRGEEGDRYLDDNEGLAYEGMSATGGAALRLSSIAAWREAVALERNARLQLQIQLDATKDQLHASKVSATAAERIHVQRLREATEKAVRIQSQLDQLQQAVLPGLQARVSTAETAFTQHRQSEIHQGFSAEDDLKYNASKLRVLVATLEGTVEVLKRQLEAVRVEHGAAVTRMDLLEDQISRQELQLYEAEMEVREASRAASQSNDTLARQHVTQLMEIRNHPLLLAPELVTLPEDSITASTMYQLHQHTSTGPMTKMPSSLMELLSKKRQGRAHRKQQYMQGSEQQQQQQQAGGAIQQPQDPGLMPPQASGGLVVIAEDLCESQHELTRGQNGSFLQLQTQQQYKLSEIRTDVSDNGSTVQQYKLSESKTIGDGDDSILRQYKDARAVGEYSMLLQKEVQHEAVEPLRPAGVSSNCSNCSSVVSVHQSLKHDQEAPFADWIQDTDDVQEDVQEDPRQSILLDTMLGEQVTQEHLLEEELVRVLKESQDFEVSPLPTLLPGLRMPASSDLQQQQLLPQVPAVETPWASAAAAAAAGHAEEQQTTLLPPAPVDLDGIPTLFPESKNRWTRRPTVVMNNPSRIMSKTAPASTFQAFGTAAAQLLGGDRQSMLRHVKAVGKTPERAVFPSVFAGISGDAQQQQQPTQLSHNLPGLHVLLKEDSEGYPAQHSPSELSRNSAVAILSPRMSVFARESHTPRSQSQKSVHFTLSTDGDGDGTEASCYKELKQQHNLPVVPRSASYVVDGAEEDGTQADHTMLCVTRKAAPSSDSIVDDMHQQYSNTPAAVASRSSHVMGMRTASSVASSLSLPGSRVLGGRPYLEEDVEEGEHDGGSVSDHLLSNPLWD